jgi:hypothetical protein
MAKLSVSKTELGGSNPSAPARLRRVVSEQWSVVSQGLGQEVDSASICTKKLITED